MSIYKSITKWSITSMTALVLCVFSGVAKEAIGEHPREGETKDILVGAGSFTYNDYAPLSDKPVKVWYYRPSGAVENMPIMILMHGNSRAAESYRDRMAPHAETFGFVLIVPEFSTDNFPGSRTYHTGNVRDRDGEPIPEDLWTFSMIEPLFDFVKADLGSERQRYVLYGFSAGSQFVHRFNWHKPDNRAEVIVAGAAGTYSMPDWEITYPYGLESTIVTEEMVKKGLANKVVVLVGGDDNNRGDHDLTKNERADAQGHHRVERAKTFFDKSKALAAAWGTPFNWELYIVPGIGHTQGPIAGPIAAYIFNTKLLK